MARSLRFMRCFLITILGIATLLLKAEGFVMDTNRQLSLVEELSYATIRIQCTRADGSISVGTGFAMAFNHDLTNNRFIPVLVTNKHVVQGSIKISFVLTEMIDGLPATGRFPFELPIGESEWLKHPKEDVDLCVLPMGFVINALQAQGKRVKISWLPLDIIAKDSDYTGMLQLDEVIMIGYPDGISDKVNNQPIFRRGSFATNPSLDYDGKKEFVVDIAAYNGSSGSPVFVKYEASRFDRDKRAIVIQEHPTVKLVGVLYGGFLHNANGTIVPVQIPTSVVPVPVTAIPNNLGIVIKAERIMELEEMVSNIIPLNA